MDITLPLKRRIISQITSSIDERILSTQDQIQSIKNSKFNETKSSVGDKFETSRTMLQLEQEKLERILAQHHLSKQRLQQIDTEKTMLQAGFGSLISTSNGIYFISIGYGKIKIDQEKVFAVSLASPIGQVLKSKHEQSEITFNGKVINIHQIC